MDTSCGLSAEVSHRLNPLGVEQKLIQPVRDVLCNVASITVPEVLSFDQQNLLVENFPEFKIRFLSETKHSHPYAAASRKLELAVLLRRLSVGGNLSLPGYDDYCCDIGGEFTVHLTRNHFGVHSCCPILDVRDGQRHTTRMEYLTRKCAVFDVTSSSSVSLSNCRKFLMGDQRIVDSFYCSNRAQDCTRTARYGIALHSSYDITLDDFASIMIRKQMFELYGSFLYSDMVLIEKQGIIPGIDCFFSIRDGSIEFSFRNDSGMVYRHDLKTYMSLLTVNSFVRSGNTFVVELLENRSGVQFFKISRLNMLAGSGIVTRFLWLPCLEGKTRVNFFDVDENLLAKGDFKNAFNKVSFFVDTAIVDKVSSHAYASTETKFRPVEIFNFLLAYNGRIFFGSDVCVRNKALPVYQAMLLANAIYVDIFRRKYKVGKINQFLLNAIKHDRDLCEASLLGKMCRWKFSPASAYGTGHSSIKTLRRLAQPFHALLNWYCKSSVDATNFLEENVSFVRCDTNLSQCVFDVFPSASKPFTHELSVPQVLLDSGSVDVVRVMSSLLSEYYSGAEVCRHEDVVPMVIREIPFVLDLCVPQAVSLQILDFISSPVGTGFLETYLSLSVDCVPFGGQIFGACVVVSSSVEFVKSLPRTYSRLFVVGMDIGDFISIIPSQRTDMFLVEGSSDEVVPSLLKLNISHVVLDENCASDSLLVGLINFPGQTRVHFRLMGWGAFTTLYALSCCKTRAFPLRDYLSVIDNNSNYFKLNVTSYLLSLTSYLEELTVRSVDVVSSGNDSFVTVDGACSEVHGDISSDSDSSFVNLEVDESFVSVSLADTGRDSTFVSAQSEFEVDFVDISVDDGQSSIVMSDSGSGVSVLSSCVDSVVCPSGPVVCCVEDDEVAVSSVIESVQVALRSFTECLDKDVATYRPGRNGGRYEWLFAPVSYSYSGTVTPSLGVLPSFLKNLVGDDFNGCLIVYYPDGTSGLGFHADDESCLANSRVLTYSVGAPFLLRLRGDFGERVYPLDSTVSYLLKHQDGVVHAVACSGPRFAFTFRTFVLPRSSSLLGTIGDGNCLFYSLVGNDFELARKMREYILVNAPVSLDNPFYDHAHVLEECSATGVWGGTATLIAFCYLFHSNIQVFNFDGECQAKLGDTEMPTHSLKLYYNGCHYDREVTHRGSVVLPFLPPVSLLAVRDFIRGFYSSEFTFYPKLSQNVFVSSVQVDCFDVNCDCINGLVPVVQQLSGNGVVHLLVLFHIDSPHLPAFLDYTADRLVQLLVVPGFISSGYILVSVSFAKTSTTNVSLSYALNRIRLHVGSCNLCNGVEAVSPPFYNHMLSTYYFCTRSGSSVVIVDSLSCANVIFSLRVMDSVVGYDQNLVVLNSKVIVPVRVSTRGVVSAEKRSVKNMRAAIARYFAVVGKLPCIGIEPMGLHNITPVVTCFEEFTSRILVLREEIVSTDVVLDYNPQFVAAVGDQSVIYNAMVESREYYRATVASVVNGVSNLHNAYLKLFSSVGDRLENDAVNNRPDYAMIDMEKGCFLVRPKDSCGPYNFAYDGKSLVDISSAVIPGVSSERDIRKWLRPGVFTGKFSVTRDTKLVNGLRIYEKLSSYSLENFSFDASITLIEGVPGCGKTHHIISNHEFSLENTNHIVLTSSREAAMDLRKRVVKAFGCPPNHRFLKLRYRTVDSFLMHYSSVDYSVDTVWLDEGLMKHFGDVLWVAYISGCRSLRIIGDRAQIPFFNRVGGINLKYHLITLSSKILKQVFLDTTHRCPRDVAVLLNRMAKYKSKVFSSSTVERSLHCRLIAAASELRGIVEGYQLLTFTQDEKNELEIAFGKGVFTINEFQGNQAEKVMLVRLNPKDIDIFKSEPHVLVGISRHTREFLYATVSRDFCYEKLSTPIGSVEIREVSRGLGGGLVMGKTQTRQYPIYKVCTRPATMVDMLKQNRKIRDFVQDNLGTGVVPLRVDCSDIEVVDVELPTSSVYYVSDPLTTIQYFYDELLPGHSVLPNDYDDAIFVQDELVFSARENIRFSTNERFSRRMYDSLSPALRTSCPTLVSGNLKQVLKAFYDRNGGVPVLNGLVDDERIAMGMYDRFVECYVGDRPLFDTYIKEPVTVNVDSIEDWLFTQPSTVAKTVFSDEFVNVFNKELNKYSLILKKLPKPKLGPGDYAKYPSPQTIAHLSKDINAFFCPLIREIKKRLFAVLRTNVVINSDISTADLERILDVRLPTNKVLKRFKYLHEIDIKKYDKSQGRVALLFETKLLEAFGFPPDLVPIWVVMHVYTRLYDHFTKFTARVFFQRKSGDPFTFLGNTLFLMAVVAFLYNLLFDGFSKLVADDDIFLLFAGDDSLFFSPCRFDAFSVSQEMANTFNLESKILEYSVPYFCSKFFLLTPWGWKIVPDVLKMITKLGRHDLINYTHVDEYRISCLDVGRHLGNSILYPFIDQAFCDRYPTGDMSSFGALYSALYVCFSSVDVFRSLYFEKETALIDHDRRFTRLNEF